MYTQILEEVKCEEVRVKTLLLVMEKWEVCGHINIDITRNYSLYPKEGGIALNMCVCV